MESTQSNYATINSKKEELMESTESNYPQSLASLIEDDVHSTWKSEEGESLTVDEFINTCCAETVKWQLPNTEKVFDESYETLFGSSSEDSLNDSQFINPFYSCSTVTSAPNEIKNNQIARGQTEEGNTTWIAIKFYQI